MEAEDEWNKNLSAHKLLDKKVPCKQNGRSGKIGVFRVSKTNIPPSITHKGYGV